MADRRAFLSGLATLPLIGGGVALIGRPVRPAQLATPEQLLQYAAFLATEMRHALHAVDVQGGTYWGDLGDAMSRHSADFPYMETVGLRAPVLLSAAGVPLAGERHG